MILPVDIIKLIFSFNSSLRQTIPYHREKLKVLLHACMEEKNTFTLSKETSLIFKQENELMEQRVRKMKKVMYFMKKYCTYQEIYEYCIEKYGEENSNFSSMIEGYKYNIDSPPFLYECLLSGCRLPFCKSSTSCIEYQDVVDMIKYCPESVHYNMGQARCRNGVSPLWAISANRNVERKKKQKIIHMLLNHGAKYTDVVYVNGMASSIGVDLMMDYSTSSS